MINLNQIFTVLALFTTSLAIFEPTGTISPNKAPVCTKVSLSIKIDGKLVPEPIVLGLFDSIVPKTVQNFIKICGNRSKKYDGSLMTYNKVPFHRIIPRFMVQGGDFSNMDGTGGSGYFSTTFPDENFAVKFGVGVLAMANSGPNTNGSQFFITTVNTTWLNGHHVVFGRVVSGMRTVRKMESFGTEDGTPKKRILISKCTVLN